MRPLAPRPVLMGRPSCYSRRHGDHGHKFDAYHDLPLPGAVSWRKARYPDFDEHRHRLRDRDDQGAAPGPPTALELTPGDRMMTLEWKAPSPAPAGVSYEYRYGTATGSGRRRMDARDRPDGDRYGPDERHGLYTFQVRSRNREWALLMPRRWTGSATPAALPSVPTNLSATRTVAAGVLTVTLDWDSAEQHWRARYPVADNYEYRTVGRATWTRLAGSALSGDHPQPGPRPAYTFEVRAVNVTGVGPAASVTSGTTGPRAHPLHHRTWWRSRATAT